MAIHFRTQGIILQKQDVGEADRVFTVFTKEFGKLKLWAISERKITSKLRGGLELFYLSEFEFIQGKMRKTIIDAVLIERYPLLRESFERMRMMQRFAQLANELIRGQEKDENIWQLFLKTFSLLNSSSLQTHNLNILVYYFLWNLLAFSGYTPSLEHIAARDPKIAEFIGLLLQAKSELLQYVDIRGINETLLREVSQEHLFKVLQN